MPHIGSNARTFTYQCWRRYLSTYDLPTVEMNVVSPSWHYCLRRPIGTWWQVDYIGFLPFWKSQWFILIGTDTHSDIFSGYGFDFPALRVLASTTMCGLPECLIHRKRIPHKLASHQRSHFTMEDFQEGDTDYGIHWLFDISLHAKTSGLIKHWDGLLKVQLTCQVRGNILQGYAANRKTTWDQESGGGS